MVIQENAEILMRDLLEGVMGIPESEETPMNVSLGGVTETLLAVATLETAARLEGGTC